MHHRSAFVFGALVALHGCQSDDISDQVLSHVENHKLTPHDLPGGNWIEKKGYFVCDGYLTRFEDQEFCAAVVPDDWEPRESNGEIYYVQPLSGQ